MRPRRYSDQQVMNAIHETIRHKGYPPTVEEIRQFVGIGSKRTVLRYLSSLEANGRIQRWPGARGIRVVIDDRCPKKVTGGEQ